MRGGSLLCSLQVRDWIITTCMESLLAKDKTKGAAAEDSMEVSGGGEAAGGRDQGG